MSTDQIAAAEFGKHTQLASLELALEGRDFAGSCDAGYSCAYTNTISWRSASTPLPMENDPRAVFERLFGDGDLDPAARQAASQADRSILDSVTEPDRRSEPAHRAARPRQAAEYLEALRDVERRIQKAEEQNSRELPITLDQPAGIPAVVRRPRQADVRPAGARVSDRPDARHHVHDRPRAERPVVSADRRAESHHPISHHLNDPAKLANLAKINVHHTSLFAYYLDKLRNTPDGDGSLLDHVMIIYGAGMADSNLHAPSGLPVLLVGGGAGTLSGGRHIRYPMDTPLANLHLALLDRLGIPDVEAIGDSSGRLEQLSM